MIITLSNDVGGGADGHHARRCSITKYERTRSSDDDAEYKKSARFVTIRKIIGGKGKKNPFIKTGDSKF